MGIGVLAFCTLVSITGCVPAMSKISTASHVVTARLVIILRGKKEEGKISLVC